MKKIVYQTDVNGYFVCPLIADESPLEPGVWLIPGGCVEDEPPPAQDGYRARWDGSQWVDEIIPELPRDAHPIQTPPVPQPTDAETAAARAALDALVTAGIITAEARAAMLPPPLA